MSDKDEEREKAIVRIKGLLSRADSSFEAEAETSLRIAHKLMREKGVTYAELLAPAQPALTDDDIDVLRGDAILGYMQFIGGKGGKARAKNLTKAQLTDIAYQGVDARMKKVSAKRRKEIAKKAAQASAEARRLRKEQGG